MRYCSQTCRSADFDWFHWAECGLVERFQDESIGIFALLVYRLMVKSSLRTCLDTYEADPAVTEKNSIYDSEDYAQAFLQVCSYVKIIKKGRIALRRSFTSIEVQANENLDF